MIKTLFTKERLDGYGLGVAFEFSNIKTRHPYRDVVSHQPTFRMAFRFWRWQFYFIAYKPVIFGLNRKERRANKLH